MKITWCMVPEIWSMNFGPFFALLHISTKNLNFEKLKKKSADIIILHKCTKNHDHILYCSLDMARNKCIYFSFWVIFSPFTSLTAQKIKIKKKKKKRLSDIIIPEIFHMTDVTAIFHFGLFFALLPLQQLKKTKF